MRTHVDRSKSALVVQSLGEDTLVSAKSALRHAGFRVINEHTEGAVLSQLKGVSIDLVLIEESEERRFLCAQIRSISTVPIIAVCDSEDEIGRITMLELGADCSMSRPVSSVELIARANALLRQRIRDKDPFPQNHTMPTDA